MQFRKDLIKRLKLPKVRCISRVLLCLFVVCFFSGFENYNSDDLYIYQWGLKNNGTFLVDKEALKKNHLPIYFNDSAVNSAFFNDIEIVEYFKGKDVGNNTVFSAKNIDIKWEKAYELFKGIEVSRDVIIALIDTGVDVTHNELIDSIWINEGEIANNGKDDDLNGYIDDIFGYNFNGQNNEVMPQSITEAHGTHAAGIMVSKIGNGGIKGVAYDNHIKLMPLKVLDSEENGYMSSVVEAIMYAKKHGAKICNISLGTYVYDQSIDNAIKNSPDMLFVVSAGNGMNFVGYSLDDRDVYPAKLNYPNVITVSNISFNGERYVSANFGSYVDIFAPGTYILSTSPFNQYAFLTGTSMSSPFVSAASAMLYSRFQNVSIQDIKRILIDSATPTPDVYGLCKSNGMLNIYNALLIASTY